MFECLLNDINETLELLVLNLTRFVSYLYHSNRYAVLMKFIHD